VAAPSANTLVPASEQNVAADPSSLLFSDSVKHLVIPSIISMWKFKSADDSGGNPLLESLNGNIGRQVWVHDADAGSKKDRENVERLREHFTRNRHRQKHSGDELLRYVKEAVGLFEFPVGRQPDAFPSSFGVRYAEPRCRLYRLTRLLLCRTAGTRTRIRAAWGRFRWM
jgi:hypothetical protein